MDTKIPVCVEVCSKPLCTLKYQDIANKVLQILQKRQISFKDGILPFKDLTDDPEENKFILQNIEFIEVTDIEGSQNYNGIVLFWQADLRVTVYQLNDEGGAEEMADEAEEIPACKQWILPSTDFNGLWNSLVFEDDIKSNLLQYATTTMLFSDSLVNPQLINWNRVILLHGPPGTGKTSLCKGLAQKLSIRLSSRYPSGGQLIEINAHSLFSKWFSESGKLVMKLFSRIHEMVEDADSFVCVLIDEVESLTAARKSALNGTEPSDSIRVVNAVLTQIDQLKNCSNVVILTTSNITKAIDLAFVDRADIKQYIGLPGVKGRYTILLSCISELVRVGIIRDDEMIPSWHDSTAVKNEYALRLKVVAEKCEGLSGRALRKVPFLAHAFFVQQSWCTMDKFLDALGKAVDKESSVRAQLQESD
ncbi:pachytene checkpoint protein TRIP13 [Acrasis kona]|uniref:Pachytene checkpoint protein TRIP13 n=1 Tax=Acrasis kona TaxID=1008807 RepID=A0AAW2Z4M8_9EUKA